MSIEKHLKNHIYRIKLDNDWEVRYWYGENDEIHIAVWDGENCIIKDTDNPTNFIVKELIKVIDKYDSFYNRELVFAEAALKGLKGRLAKISRQRNYYSRLLKEKNELIRELRFESKRWKELYGKAVEGEYPYGGEPL